MYKVALWGLGEGYNLFMSQDNCKKVDVVAVTDAYWSNYYKKIDGFPVVEPDEILSFSFDYLIVCAIEDRIFKDIVNSAENKGIAREIILPSRIFQIPFFDFDDYVQVKKSNISILSDNCIAGFLYHKFGLKFTSPTINMFSDNENYLKFLRDIKGHLSVDIVEDKDALSMPYCGSYSYPRGLAGDSTWLFNHDIVFETAAARWKKGVDRFNYNNYIVIMTICSDRAAYEFDGLPIKHKIGFYWKELNLESVLCVKEWNDPKVRAMFGYAFDRLIINAAIETRGMRLVNWLNLLLHKDDFCRMTYM